MLNIENARPSVKALLSHIDEFEKSCMGDKKISPSRFRSINEELSIGAVLLIGKHRYAKNDGKKHLIWRGLDDREHDLGSIHDVNVMREYPGFHATRTLSLGNNYVIENKVVDVPGSRNNISVVTLKDGSVGIGPNYRLALRNAAIRMHIKERFARTSLSWLWSRVWGHA